MPFDNPKRTSKQGKNISHATCLWLMAYCLFLPQFDVTCIIIVQMYKKALTMSTQVVSADEVKGEGVVFFQYLRNNVIRDNAI